MAVKIYTLGYANRDRNAMIDWLKAFDIKCLVDARSLRESEKPSQFSAESLSQALKEAGIEYERRKNLGGYRHEETLADSLNWHGSYYRGYADYLQSEGMNETLEELIRMAKERPTALLCAESDREQCHRSLLADTLTTYGLKVLHITGSGETREHETSPLSKVEGNRIDFTESPQEQETWPGSIRF